MGDFGVVACPAQAGVHLLAEALDEDFEQVNAEADGVGDVVVVEGGEAAGPSTWGDGLWGW